MSFYTSLTGLNAATAMLGVTSNNISNVGTTGFKRSRADFGDIFATSPLQKASSTVGQGVSLKQVSQEFSQGNISFSSNALDLAVTGDGFFPMRSADGLQETFTRNGSFLLNEQYNVVNSAGQRLMAATVDSTGSANVNDRVVLTIPQKTSGEAKQTSLVSLGLNFPADASVITAAFNRANPATYNKSTAFTVYDAGGNGYLATVYYVKTKNADSTSPTNTWQTQVYVGEDRVNASLQQATDSNGQKRYVNQYGELRSYSEVKDELTTAKTQLFSLNDLTDKRSSSPAVISGTPVTQFDFSNGVNFKTLNAASANNSIKNNLASLFQVKVDGSKDAVNLDLSYLADTDAKVTGSMIASQVTAQLNQKFGSGCYFDLTDVNSQKFQMANSRLATSRTDASTGVVTVTDNYFDIKLTPGVNGLPSNPKQITINQMQAEIQSQVNYGEYYTSAKNAVTTATIASTAYKNASTTAAKDALVTDALVGLPTYAEFLLARDITMTTTATTKASAEYIAETTQAAKDARVAAAVSAAISGLEDGSANFYNNGGGNTGYYDSDVENFIQANPITSVISPTKVQYDFGTSSFKFTDSGNTIKLKTDPGQLKNDVFKLTPTTVTLDPATGHYDAKVIPNGLAIRPAEDQRFGMAMTYDSVNKVFNLKSGTTGDTSSIAVTGVVANSMGAQMFGLTADAAATDIPNNYVATSTVALRGTVSKAASALGTTPLKNISNNFAVDETNNKFIVTVDGVKGTVVIPVSASYSLDLFKAELQKGINALGANTESGAPLTVSGAKVAYDDINKRFTFTSGTSGNNSFMKISGSADWGLDQVEAARGADSTWIKPTQHTDVVAGVSQPKYIDGQGLETTSGDGFVNLPAWSPVYLSKGELTFSTGGKLVSPVQGTQLEPVYLAGGKGVLTINVNYSASTQYTSPFAVLSQSQDGAPEGDLVGVTIGNDGLVSASFSNGTQKSLAKILLANFSSPVGLRQMGDSTFLASAASGKATLGNAGSAGFGTLRAGATERANVDLTQELVDLITAQRNFQANAKAIETSTTMTSAIINLRA
jgi:flagellar hook-basal body protein